MTRFGKYEVLDEIGRGGFGMVYRGRDTVLKRMVAIKTCDSKEEDVRKRFRREAEIVASLQHPNITTMHDLGTHERVPYLVQEFLTGEDLSEIIGRREPLTVEARLSYLIQIARGLEYAHSRGIVHRDIKPDNIRVLEDGTVKIMDFGIAKLNDRETRLTRTGTMLGTAAYLAPEQIDDSDVDHRSDIFSFGVLAYELMTNVRPFNAPGLSALLYQVIHTHPDPIRHFRPESPPELSDLVEKCMAKDREERPSSVSEVLEVLYKITGDTERISANVNLGPPFVPPQTPRITDTSDDPTGQVEGEGGAPAETRFDRPKDPIKRNWSQALTPAPRWAAALLIVLAALAAGILFLPRLLAPDAVQEDSLGATTRDQPPAQGGVGRVATGDSEESLGTTDGASNQLDEGSAEPEDAATPAAETAPDRTTPGAGPEEGAVKDAAELEVAREETTRPPVAANRPATSARDDGASRSASDSSEVAAASAPPGAVNEPAEEPQANDQSALPSEPDAAALAAEEEEAIRLLLGRYEQANEQLDASALRRLWVSLDATQVARITRSFNSLSSLEMSLQECEITVDGERATAACRVSQTVKPKAGRRQESTRNRVFAMRKLSGAWLIDGLEG